METNMKHSIENEIKSVKSTGDFCTELRNYVPEPNNDNTDDVNNIIDEKAEDVIGCVHYKRRAKFVVSNFNLTNLS